MCGICGYYNCEPIGALERMLAHMFLRGPDDEGTHTEPGLGLGIRRLSIIDPQGGHQPVSNENGTVWVVQNGEIYNFRRLREQLLAKGHRFTTRSDTEVIVHLYEDYGEEMLQHLRGMFGIALWDSANHVLLLARDRLGIKPLYYARRNGGVVFASDLRAVREAVPDLTIRPGAVARYLQLLYVPSPDTFFEGVSQVPPGHYMLVTESDVATRTYYDIASRVKETKPLSPDELQERFRDKLKETVDSHLVSDVPLGLLLSGGLDSAGILAMMRSVTDGAVKTFSIGYEADADSDFNETGLSRLLADTFGADHTEELLRPDVVTLLPRIVASMDEPFADSSAIPTYLVSEVARRSVTVALSGVGGDELFGGYPRYIGAQTASVYLQAPKLLRSILGHLAPMLPEKGGHRDHVARLKRFLKTGMLPLTDQYLHWVTFLPSEWGARALCPALRDEIDIGIQMDGYARLFDDWPWPMPADRAMGLDLQTYLPDDLLRLGDRMSMAHSLELRVPFCDHELLEMALQVPANLRLRGWRLKDFMRRSLGSTLPQQVLTAPKRGFMLPIARWLREDLSEMAGDLLSESSIRSRGYVEYPYVKWLLAEHNSGRRNFSDQIYALLVLELWMRGQQSCSRTGS